MSRRPRPLALPLVLALCGLVPVLLAGGCSTSRLDTEFQAALDSLHAEIGFPGATAAYLLPDGTVRGFATGVADRETGEVMTPAHRMLAGSVGKQWVGATAVALILEGRLALDAPISTWLGDEDWFGRLRGGDGMTLRHLLNHSSGVYDHLSNEDFLAEIAAMVAPGGDPDACPTHREIVEWLLDRDPYHAAGTAFHYADANYILVGLIIEKVVGRPFYEEATARFLRPLDLALTVPSDRRDIPGLAAGYMRAENPFGLPEKTLLPDGTMNHNPALEWCGGGFASNPQDLVRWAGLLYRGRLFEEDYVGLVTDHVEWPGDEDALSYGISSFAWETGAGRVWGHTGWYPGYHTVLAYYPDRDFAVAVQVNRDYDSGCKDVAARLAEVVKGRLGE